MNRRFIVPLAVCLLIVCGIWALTAQSPDTQPEAKPALSSLSEEQCLQTLTELGVTIPKELKNIDILSIVNDLEEDPDRPAPVVSYTLAHELFENVRSAVKEYYGVTGSASD